MTHNVHVYPDRSFTAKLRSQPAATYVAACQLANAEAAAGRYVRITDSTTGELIADTHPPVNLVDQPTTRAPAAG